MGNSCVKSIEVEEFYDFGFFVPFILFSPVTMYNNQNLLKTSKGNY